MHSTLECVALIPGRAGSKGIPGKNLRMLGEKPLIVWSIEAALNTPSITRVIVSTDGDEIAEVSGSHGAEVIMRPAELSGDDASSESALLHALDCLLLSREKDPDLVVFLQPTSPLRRKQDVQQAIEALLAHNADSLFSARRIEGFVWRQEGGELSPVQHDPQKRKRRQELNHTTFEENGSIYVFQPWVLRTLKNRLGGKIAVYQMDIFHSLQVDRPEDLDLMEQIVRLENLI
jgi:CMP-N,N'-diacetyllegionaminic acid synthase